MYCPNCAKAASTDQNFCRSCGFSLERTSESLLEQLSGDPALGLRRSEHAMERVGSFAFTGFGVVVAAGIFGLIYIVLTRMVLSGAQPIFGIFLAVFLVFAGLSLAFVFWREGRKDQPPAPPSTLRHLPENPVSLHGLSDGSAFEPAQSVVEATTDLLVAENKTRKIADRSSGESL